ncbi:immune inhibitor A [candidate division KSB1 bacterium]|nr:immune inhibitor A [candidate division KSB1 bacterium]
MNHYRLAVLLVEFPDTPASYAPADFEQMLFSEGYTYVSPAPGEPAFGSLRDYYLAMSNGMLSVTGQAFNWVQADSNKSYYERHGNLRFEAINKSGVSLADFDGYVVIYAGTVGPSGSNLWPQAFSTGGKLHYVMSEKWLSRYEFAPIGVHCHEFGHLLGLPDFQLAGRGPVVHDEHGKLRQWFS